MTTLKSLAGQVIKSVFSLAAIAATISVSAAQTNGTVNIYSYRQPFLIRPLLEEFTKETGIKTRIIFAKKGLAARIGSEGANSPADVILTTDIGRLDGAKKLGITRPVKSQTINTNIPARYRDAEGQWFGITTRARIIFASSARVGQDTITYEELADPKWKGRICTRSGQHPYSLGLFASLIAHHGEKWTETWLTGLKNNLARKPSGNDRNQVKAIFSGVCDIALGNNYYMGKMETNEKEPVQKEWAASVRILFPNAKDRGTHVNISGMAMAKFAPNRKNALKLMEFLSSTRAQQIYGETNFEYPVKEGIPASARVASWGTLKPDSLSIETIAKYRKTASELVDKTGFNDGPSS